MSIAVLLGIAATAAFNVWVDPYRLFGVLPESRLTAVKARPESNIGAIKLLNAIDAQPQCVIIGNSRADIGFSPEHPGWGACRGHVYNLAVPGAGISTVREDFRALIERAPVKTALLAVDFQDFVINADPVGTPLNHPKAAPERLRAQERLHAAFTLTGLADSIATLRASRQKFPATLAADGLNPLLDYLPIAEREGYPSMFRQRLNETTANYVRARTGIYPRGASDSAEFQALRDIIDLSRDRGIQLYVVTYPYHADYYAVFDRLGLWPEFEKWKRALATTVYNSANAHPDSPAPQLWDFASVSPLTTLAVAPSPDRGSAIWFWEPGHFKQSLGDLVLNEVIGSGPDPAERMGVQLTRDNLDGWLALQRAALDDFLRQHPDQAALVRAAVQQAEQAAARNASH